MTARAKKLLIGFSVILLAAFGIYGYQFYLTFPLQNTIDHHLAALRAQDYEKAYSYTSLDFQNSTSFDSFKQFINTYPALEHNNTFTPVYQTAKRTLGRFSGTLQAKEGNVTPIEYVMIFEDNAWKILSMKIEIPGMLTHPFETRIVNREPMSLEKTFESNNGFSIQYPREWMYTMQNPSTVIFSGKKGTEAYSTTIHIQDIPSVSQDGKQNTLEKILTEQKDQILTKRSGSQILEQDAFKLIEMNGQEHEGLFFIASFTSNNEKIKQFQIVMPKSEGNGFLTWTFSAPDYLYERAEPIALDMLNSWVISK